MRSSVAILTARLVRILNFVSGLWHSVCTAALSLMISRYTASGDWTAQQGRQEPISVVRSAPDD